MYVDRRSGGEPLAIGWVFVKRVPYDDSPRETYLREVWVERRDVGEAAS